MRGMTHDMRQGLFLSLLAAITFGTSGTFASPLLDSGWSPGAVVLGRVLIGGLVLAVPAVLALRGRWHLLRADLPLVLGYGFVVVAFTQFAYFSAVARMDVAVALLVEYVAPVAVLGWLWAAHGQRPTRLTIAGAVLAILGLVLVLDLFSGADANVAGIAWGLAAMAGCAVYFLLSARPSHLPPTALAGSGLLLGALVLAAAGALGIIAMDASTAAVSYRGTEVPWWLPLVGVAVVSTSMAYFFGIGGSRLLGSRLASFVGLLEVVAALVLAWALLGESPAPIQLLGGLGILSGVVLVKLGEPEAQADPALAGVLTADEHLAHQ